MPTTVEIRKRLEVVFNEKQAIVLSDVITSSYNELVKTSDFNELKGIVKEIAGEVRGIAGEVRGIAGEVKELAEAQKRTEIKVEELAEAQKRTEIKVEELAEAQKRTEIAVQKTEMAVQKTEIAVQKTEIEVQKLAKGLKETNQNLGGLSRSVGYAFENEVYRMLPGLLKNSYGIEMEERLIRTEINGTEINILGKAKMNGKDVVVIGEAKLRLDEKRKKDVFDVFSELEEKVEAVKENYKEEPIRMLITHYATKGFIKRAKDEGVIVIQSFEW